MRGTSRNYGSSFQIAWETYKPPKSANKYYASIVYEKIRRELPAQPLLLACIEAYNYWLVDNPKQLKCHFATWLQKRSWEDWLEDAQKIIARRLSEVGPSKSISTAIKPSRPMRWWMQPKQLWKPDWNERDVPTGHRIRDVIGGKLREPERVLF